MRTTLLKLSPRLLPRSRLSPIPLLLLRRRRRDLRPLLLRRSMPPALTVLLVLKPPTLLVVVAVAEAAVVARDAEDPDLRVPVVARDVVPDPKVLAVARDVDLDLKVVLRVSSAPDPRENSAPELRVAEAEDPPELRVLRVPSLVTRVLSTDSPRRDTSAMDTNTASRVRRENNGTHMTERTAPAEADASPRKATVRAILAPSLMRLSRQLRPSPRRVPKSPLRRRRRRPPSLRKSLRPPLLRRRRLPSRRT
jgi:hypothetical protein